MKLEFFLLDGHEVRACSRAEWADWLENRDALRLVDYSEVHAPGHRRVVQTLFLALPRWREGGQAPFFFGTTAILDGQMLGPGFTRSWDEARAMHRAYVAAVVGNRLGEIGE